MHSNFTIITLLAARVITNIYKALMCQALCTALYKQYFIQAYEVDVTYYCHLTDEKTEAQEVEVHCPKSHRL